MNAVLEIVMENVVNRKMISLEDGGQRANITDTDTLVSARALWYLVVQRTIIQRVENEVISRKLLPVTIHTLCALLLDVLNEFH